MAARLQINPKIGKHPDLFGGETDVFVNIYDMSREELETLNRSHFTKAELKLIKETDKDLYLAILDNTGVDDYIAIIISRLGAKIEAYFDDKTLVKMFTERLEDAVECYADKVVSDSVNLTWSEIYRLRRDTEDGVRDIHKWELGYELVDNSDHPKQERHDWIYTCNDPVEFLVDVSDLDLEYAGASSIEFALDDRKIPELNVTVDFSAYTKTHFKIRVTSPYLIYADVKKPELNFTTFLKSICLRKYQTQSHAS